MLQKIRDNVKGWLGYLFFGTIAIVFIFWGVQMRSVSGSDYAAKVNGDRIPIETINRAWQERQQRLQQMLHGEIPEAMKKAQQQAVLDEHIRTQLLSQRADDLGYRVSNAQMRETISGFPDLQVDGKFSPERYELLLRQQGRSVPQFEKELRASLRVDQLQRGIAASSFITPGELQRRQALEGERREIEYAVIPMSGFLANATVSDNEVQTYYDAHKPDFMTPETVDLEYLELKLADVAKDVEVSDAALKEYYEQVKDRLTTPERRKARHILITVGDGVDDASAKKKAEEVLAKLKAGGDFATLAKQYSQDTISAVKGGELDWATRGENVGPYDEALFAMSPGEVRGPIRTQFGYHIIKLDAKEGGETKSFDAARDELTAEYKTDKAQSLFYDRSQKLGDESFNALTELDTTATALGLPLHKISGFSRQGGGTGSEALDADPKNISKLADAAFAADAIDKRQNSSLIQLADDHVVVIRVAAHRPPEQKPLAVVRLEIESKLKQRAAKEAAAKRGAELLARVAGGADWNKALAEFKITPVGNKSVTRTESSIPAPVRQSVFAVRRDAVSADKAAYRGVTIDNGDYSVVRVSAIHPGKLEAGTPESASKRQQAAQSLGNDEFGAYLADVEAHAKIERNPKLFE